MLKTTTPLKKSTSSKLEIGNGENHVGVNYGSDGVEIAKKSEKSKGQKLAKSQKMSKSRKSKSKKSKKLLKSGNSSNFDVTEAGPSFLIPDAKINFNCLCLAFIKVPILWHFDMKYHIWIKIDASSYAIGGILSQLTSKTSPDGVITKAHLSQWHLVLFFFRKMIFAET